MPTHTATEKIVARHSIGLAAGHTPSAGDYVTIRPKHLMTHDNTGAVIPKFLSIMSGVKRTGGTPTPPRIKDNKQPVFGIDHDIQNKSAANLGKYTKIEAFAHEQGIDYHPPGRGIAHQIMIEEGYVTPGSLVVGSDSHSNIYGAIGAVGTPVVRTDAAAIWATGETWWQIPEQVQVILEGELPPGATGKDVIITLCGHFNNDEVLNCCLEFTGPGVATLTIEERMTISNMTTEWGALTGMFPFDDALKDFLLDRARFFASRNGSKGKKRIAYTEADIERWWSERDSFASDADAHYSKVLTLDLASVSPHVAGPNSVKVMASAAKLEGEKITINRAYLMSCVNARLTDFEAAANVFAGNGTPRTIAKGVSFYIAAASSDVEAQAKTLGYWNTLLDAGAIALPPGCGACIGLGMGTLEPGEVGISATNRNFEGRMGDRTAQCYLASPVVVAESACRGYIAAPQSRDGTIIGSIDIRPAPAHAAKAQPILDGFPARITGRALYLPLDNLNTDGIYGKDVTYRDDITPEQQGQYAMLNYDPQFQSIAQDGDIIVGSRNFGTGSSREQAATALASRGIRMVIASTSGQTYKRNAFNNGFIVIECPALSDQLAAMFAEQAASGTRTIAGPTIDIDFGASTITCDGKTHPFGTLSETAQRLIVAGGSEAVVQEQLGGN